MASSAISLTLFLFPRRREREIRGDGEPTDGVMWFLFVLSGYFCYTNGDGSFRCDLLQGPSFVGG